MARRKPKMSEENLQVHVCKLLTAFGRPDIVWFVVPNGEKRSRKTGARLKQQGVKAGAPDLCFIIDEQFIGLELKTEVGIHSDAQLKFQEDLERAGGGYLVAYGLEQAISKLIALGAFRPNVHINVKGLTEV